MKTYCIIIMLFEVLSAGILLGSGKVGNFFGALIGTSLLLPIFGRILGWW